MQEEQWRWSWSWSRCSRGGRCPSQRGPWSPPCISPRARSELDDVEAWHSFTQSQTLPTCGMGKDF